MKDESLCCLYRAWNEHFVAFSILKPSTVYASVLLIDGKSDL